MRLCLNVHMHIIMLAISYTIMFLNVNRFYKRNMRMWFVLKNKNGAVKNRDVAR
jgi:hypothetical protein